MIFKSDIFIYNIYYLKVFLNVAIMDFISHFEHVQFYSIVFIYL